MRGEPRQVFSYQKRLRFYQLIRFWVGLVLAIFAFLVMAEIWSELSHASPPVWDPISPLVLLLLFLTGISLVISSIVEDFKDFVRSFHQRRR